MMFKKYILPAAKVIAVIIIFSALTAFVSPHRFYLSLTEIRADTKKQTLDVSCKLFTNDLEDALQRKYGKKIDLASSVKNKDVQMILSKYINENFKINVGGKLQTLSFVGYEIESDAAWCYLEAVPFTSKGRAAVYNTLLYDYLPEQSNMINFNWDDIEKSAKLSAPEKMAEFEF